MKKFAFALVALCSFSAFGVTGCGPGTDTTVIQAPPEEAPEMTPEEEEAYAKELEKSMTE